ncbi:hypothetical protein [Subtercola lobariae]|nr:hypothetical protein [Subtercola lobariae]
MAAAVGGRNGSRIQAGVSLITGAVMLAVLTLPSFPASVGCGALLAVISVSMITLVVARIRSNRASNARQKSVTILVLVDVWFMALALLLMPAHRMDTPATTASSPAASSLHMPHEMLASNIIGTLVLVDWALCAAVLIVPAIHKKRAHTIPHATCTLCMILAMTVMSA